MSEKAEKAAVTILRAVAGTDVEEFGLKKGEHCYIVRDPRTNTFRVVRWTCIGWVCSCGKGQCQHKLEVNEFVFMRSQQQKRVLDEDLTAHIEEGLHGSL